MATLSGEPLPGTASSPTDVHEFGIDLLVNTRKKGVSSQDALSILSSRSGRSHGKGAAAEHALTDNESLASDDLDGYPRHTNINKPPPSIASSSGVSRPSRRPSAGKGAAGKQQQAQQDDAYWTRRPRNEVEALAMKRELLYEFERMRNKGYRLPRMYTMETSLEDMQADYTRLKRDREVDAGVMFQRQMLMTCVSGIEFLSTNFSPFDCHLDGWSHHVSDSMDKYDDILEELYVKYKSTAKMAPELRLLLTLGGSAVMFSMQNRIANMAEDLMHGGDHTAPRRRGSPPRRGSGGGGLFSGLGGIGSLIGSLFSGGGGGGGGAQAASAPPPPTHAYHAAMPMKGPSLNVDSVLKDLQHNAFHRPTDQQRVEIISTISDSEVPDDASILSGPSLRMQTPAAAKQQRHNASAAGRRTLDLSDM